MEVWAVGWAEDRPRAAEFSSFLRPLAAPPRASAAVLPGVSLCHLPAAPTLGPRAEVGTGEREMDNRGGLSRRRGQGIGGHER